MFVWIFYVCAGSDRDLVSLIHTRENIGHSQVKEEYTILSHKGGSGVTV